MVRKNNPDPNTQQYACGTATRTARNTQDFAMTTWQEELRGSIRDAAGLRRNLDAGFDYHAAIVDGIRFF